MRLAELMAIDPEKAIPEPAEGAQGGGLPGVADAGGDTAMGGMGGDTGMGGGEPPSM